MTDTEQPIRVGYTRGGKKLHAIRMDEDAEKVGRTLCDNRLAWRHPNFGDEAMVAMSLSFNFGCERCLKKLSAEGDDDGS